MQIHAQVSRSPSSRAHHRYAVLSAKDGWAVTRDGRSIGAFPTRAEALCVAETITRDLARAGIDVEFAVPAGVRW